MHRNCRIPGNTEALGNTLVLGSMSEDCNLEAGSCCTRAGCKMVCNSEECNTGPVGTRVESMTACNNPEGCTTQVVSSRNWEPDYKLVHMPVDIRSLK